jgi:DNA-binding CsgD family transcriptional regulator
VAGLGTGFILLDAALNLVACNQEALQILAFPTPRERITRIDSFIRDKIQANLLVTRKAGAFPKFVSKFRSGDRSYSCGAYSLERRTASNAELGVVLLLERELQPFVDMPRVAAQFDLTPREQETVEHLLRGLTTKEIAERMKISPSTVNAFLRLVMVKVGVSNRSAVVQRILRPHGGSRPVTSSAAS